MLPITPSRPIRSYASSGSFPLVAAGDTLVTPSQAAPVVPVRLGPPDLPAGAPRAPSRLHRHGAQSSRTGVQLGDLPAEPGPSRGRMDGLAHLRKPLRTTYRIS